VKKGTYKGRFRAARNAFPTTPVLFSSPSRVVNVPGRTTKPARTSQVKMVARMLSTTGTSSNSMAKSFDRGMLLGVPDVSGLFRICFVLSLRLRLGGVPVEVPVATCELPGEFRLAEVNGGDCGVPVALDEDVEAAT
jgi:hypothetical protein